jgi:hypothetical protein
MDGQTFVEEIRSDKRTELDRLASEKALLAVTRADLSAGTILETVALTLEGLRATLEEWAGETAAGPAREAFAEGVAALGEECERIGAQLDAEPAGDPPAPVPTVREFEGTPERVGAAFVGHGLVFDGVLLQAVSFFVNEAERGRADLVRDLRSGASERVDEGGATLEAVCADADDWERADSAARAVVGAAYEDYRETLAGMGIDPKPVC